MKKFIKTYNNPNENRINHGIMSKEYDESLITYLTDTAKSLEVLKYIKFKGYTYQPDEHMIDYNDYIKTRRTKKKNDTTKYMLLQDSRYGELTLHFEIKCKGKTRNIYKSLLIPTADKNGYYTIKGKKYFLLYQLVDNSTYTTKENLVLKSLMPIPTKREGVIFSDTNKNKYNAPVYIVYLFRKEVNILLFYFVKFGFKKTLEYFSVNKIMRVCNDVEDDENNVYFQINSRIFLEVNKIFFNKYQYVRSIAFMILSTVNNRLLMDNLEDSEYWIKKIGAQFSTNLYNYKEKGLNTLTFFDRMLDETTKRILRIDYEHKSSIYAIVRWMIQNFNELKKKNNLNINNKRLRCNEFIASLLTKEFSTKLNRIISLGSKVTIDRVEEIFNFSGEILLTQLFKSNLLRYDDIVNDQNMWNFFKYTLKGPNSVGNKNQNNISKRMRGTHPSYLGKVDISVIGASEPGISSIVTPFCKTDGLFFNSNSEPQAFKKNFEKELYEHMKLYDKKRIFIDEPDDDSNAELLCTIVENTDIESEIYEDSKYNFLHYKMPNMQDIIMNDI